MNIIRKKPTLFLIIAVAFYFSGVLFIKPDDIERLKEDGIVRQRDYTYVDSEGEEHEGSTLIEVVGMGKILTYRDVYFSSVGMFVVAMVIGALLFGGGEKTTSDESLKHIVFANCILGVLLIRLTTKDTIWSTVMFWLGIIVAYSVVRTLMTE